VPARLDGLSFFFPALNEEDHVGPILNEALTILPRFADDFDVTVVDDGSSDRTGAIADDVAAPWVFYTDGDRQFELADLERLISASDGIDAVVGYREKRADPPRRLFVAWVYNRLIRLLFGGGWRDVDCAFKLFRRDVFTRVPLERVRSNGAFFSPELLITLQRAGVRIRQVGVRHFPRTAHEAKGASPRVILRAIRDLLRLRARLWLRPRD